MILTSTLPSQSEPWFTSLSELSWTNQFENQLFTMTIFKEQYQGWKLTLISAHWASESDAIFAKSSSSILGDFRFYFSIEK